MKSMRAYSEKEEWVNALSHAVGCLMGVGVCAHFLYVSRTASWLVILALAIYLFGVVGSYLASTIYHAISVSNSNAKLLARKFDHAAIYWHIAGSYTPITLIAMVGGGEVLWASIIFTFIWLCAIVGSLLCFGRLKDVSYIKTACYVLMGLTIFVAFKPFYNCCGKWVLLWVVAEGVSYIVGAVLYSFKKVPYMHSVFHFFVLLGDVCHMIAVWLVLQMYVLSPMSL